MPTKSEPSVATLQSVYDGINTLTTDALTPEIEFVDMETLPDEENVPLEAAKWVRVKNVACLWVDMIGSSAIDYQNETEMACKAFQVFTGNLTSIWRTFGAAYFDIKGDGGFALFDGSSPAVRAFLASVTLRTSLDRYVREKVSQATDGKIVLRARSAMSFGDVTVKRIGFRGRYNHNLVWLDSTINQGAKLLEKVSRTEDELLITAATYAQMEHDKIRTSCGCSNGLFGARGPLWKEKTDLGLEAVGINTAYSLRSLWCKTHGATYFKDIVRDHELVLGTE